MSSTKGRASTHAANRSTRVGTSKAVAHRHDESSSVRPVSVAVKDLFGKFDYEIPLKGRERVTIIYGLNGCGKTTILEMISALARGRLAIFEHTPFSEFRINFEDGSAWALRRRTDAGSRSDRRVPEIESLVIDSRGKISAEKLPQWPKELLERVDREVPRPFVRSQDGWIDDDDRWYTPAEILERFPQVERLLPSKLRHLQLPNRANAFKVYFIEANRLSAQPTDREGSRTSADHFVRFRDGFFEESAVGPARTLRVEQYSSDVVQRIGSALAEYAKHSQELDRTFPERLVTSAREGRKRLSGPAILHKIEELEVKRRRLVSFDVIDRDKGLQNLDVADVGRARDALTMYVEDVEKKLRVFDDIADRMGRLIELVNSRFSDKRLAIDRDHGFLIESDSGGRIALEDLSSGEQHTMVVMYELLFCAPRGCLVLVDEPEISLHVGWQERFVSDLISILNVTDGRALVATHSPTVVGRRWNLTWEMGGKHGGGGK
jgi:predicted ATP-binding protein involved in virulence